MRNAMIAFLTGTLITTTAWADSLVVPSNYTNTPGTTTFLGPLTNGPRTYQLLIHESLLASLVGQQLTGLSWRLPASATSNWPGVDATYSSYDIYLSGSVTPADRSLTFSENVVGPQTQVRSGSLFIPTGSYTFGGSPNAWGPEIAFSPYVYNGGHLLVEIRHTGSNATSRSVDALGTSTSGYGTLFSAAWQSSYTATTGLQGNFSLLRFSAEPVPGPGALVATALGLLGMARRRRRYD